jgi:hypothetical protein
VSLCAAVVKQFVGACGVWSVHGLCLIHARYMEMPGSLRPAVSERPWKEALDVDAAAEHVLAFSLAGIRATHRDLPE